MAVITERAKAITDAKRYTEYGTDYQPGEMVSFLPLGIERWIDVAHGAAQSPQTVLCKLAEVTRRDLLELGTLGVQSRVDGRVRSLAVQSDAIVLPQNHRHSLSVVVEVQNAQQLVNFRSAHHFDRYRVRRPSLHGHIFIKLLVCKCGL